MRYLLDVWFKSWLELSAVDKMIMTGEVVALLFLIVFIKIWIIDSLRGVKYYKGPAR